MSQHRVVAVVLTSVALLCCSVGHVDASLTKLIDQHNSGPRLGTNGGANFGQSFTPALPGIDYVEFLMAGDKDTVTVDILAGLAGFDGLGGPVIATSNPTFVDTLATHTHQVIHFDFPSTVSLIPGNTYTFRVQTPAGIGGVSYTGNSYSGGQYLLASYATSEFLSQDAFFEEGVMVEAVPAPGAIVLGLLGVGLVGRLHRRKAL